MHRAPLGLIYAHHHAMFTVASFPKVPPGYIDERQAKQCTNEVQTG
jgi:hypothetical protein